jgi:large subunit ribosomal protein L35
MPKLKTNQSAAKRFRVTAKGGFKHRHSNRSHLLTKKAAKRKRHLGPMSLISNKDEKAIKKMLAQS